MCKKYSMSITRRRKVSQNTFFNCSFAAGEEIESKESSSCESRSLWTSEDSNESEIVYLSSLDSEERECTDIDPIYMKIKEVVDSNYDREAVLTLPDFKL